MPQLITVSSLQSLIFAPFMEIDTSLSCPASNSTSAPGFTHAPDSIYTSTTLPHPSVLPLYQAQIACPSITPFWWPFGAVNDFPFIHREVHWLVTLLRCAPFVRSCNRPLPALVAWCILAFINHTYWFGTTDSPSVQLLNSYGITWSLVDDTCFTPPSVIGSCVLVLTDVPPCLYIFIHKLASLATLEFSM